MSGAPDPEDDPRVVAAVRAYAAAVESGARPDRAAFLARDPDVADAVAECLDGLDLAETLRATEPGPAPTGVEDGAQLGDFRIVREIGRGGMGVVYEAEQLSLGRRVALKVLPFSGEPDDARLARFRAEAQAAARLRHPHLLPVYAVGAADGAHYYAMQLVVGRALDVVVRERRAAGAPCDAAHQRDAARLCADAADALAYAHGAGLVHRDVKPANLLLDADGTLYVADFGLARAAADLDLTEPGAVVGTLRYASPEQAAGDHGLVDHRADVYGLGATLYELLTGRPPFVDADRVALLRRVLDVDPPPPRRVEPRVAADLETVVLKALAKSPADRYATARDMADDLRRFADGRAIVAAPPTPFDRALRTVRRRPRAAAALFVATAALAAGLAAFSAIVDRERGRAEEALYRESLRAAQAEARLKLARKAADDMIALAEDEFGNPLADRRPRRKLLESALSYYGAMIEESGAGDATSVALAETRAKVERLLEDLAALDGDVRTTLLFDEDVLADLGATPEQRARLADSAALSDAERAKFFRDFRGLSAEQRQQRFLELARAADREVRGVLDDAQAARLRQIELWRAGPSALREPRVATAIALTAEQRDALRGIEEDYVFDRNARGGGPRPGASTGAFADGGARWSDRDGGRERRRPGGPGGGSGVGPPPRGGGPGGRGGPERDAARARRAALDRALALLTPSQTAEWSRLAGPPFAVVAADRDAPTSRP